MGKSRENIIPASKESQDLLSYIPNRERTGDPAQYLTVKDFIDTPDTNNADYYPSANQPLEVGQTPSTYFGGGIPIFEGNGSLPPYAVLDKREEAFKRARLANALYKQRQQEQGQGQFVYGGTSVNNPAWNDVINKHAYQTTMNFVDQAKQAAGGDSKKANAILFDVTNPIGKNFANFQTTTRVLGENINQTAEAINNLREETKDGKNFLMPGAEQAIKRFESGQLIQGEDPQALMGTIAQIHSSAGAQGVYNEFLGKLESDKVPNATIGGAKKKAGYYTEAVDPEKAQQHALEYVRMNGGAFKAGLASGLNLPASTPDEDLAKALADQGVAAKGYQYNKIPVDQGPESERPTVLQLAQNPITIGATGQYLTPDNQPKLALFDDKTGAKVGDVSSEDYKKYQEGKYTPPTGQTVGVETYDSNIDIENSVTLPTGITINSSSPEFYDLNENQEEKHMKGSFDFEIQKIGDVPYIIRNGKKILVGADQVKNDPSQVHYMKAAVVTPPTGFIKGEKQDNPIIIPFTKDQQHILEAEKKNKVKFPPEFTFDTKKKSQPLQASAAPQEGQERAVQGGTAIFKGGKWVMK